ncbi:MAG TPA: thioredoxin domain-containing protein, partial [Anaerolineales bacterium]
MTKRTLNAVALTLNLLTMVTFMTCSEETPHSPQKNHTGVAGIPEQSEIAKLPPDGGEEFNRLIFEKSPYLLQHARNPVDWYAWGPEAFEKARAGDKPVFLSIGYSTCHWCHVMAHESFEDTTVARLMNEAFVCIKVDREERPDVDQIYMSVCQAMTGSGGWPLTVIMAPDKRPFFAGTYFPKKSMHQRIGMTELVPRVADLWRNQRASLLENANKMMDFLKDNANPKAGDPLGAEVLNQAFQQLSGRYDSQFGGFGQAPKFPSPHNFTFLLRYWQRTQEPSALQMVENTLQQMRLGGIYDHVGFGFHRYSTDSQWLLPHFEKMLYDQALLALAYLETFQATGKPEYAATAREIFTYVLRDMTSPEGGFYSAEDADSEGEEGLFYLWREDELRDVLGEEDGDWVITRFGVQEGGNFHDQATGRKTGDSILHLKIPLAPASQKQERGEDAEAERWQTIRQKLFDVREERIHPLKDDKILTDWNGLMVAALSRGAAALSEPEYAAAAARAADFILTRLRTPDGALLKRYRLGEAALPAHADDYAFMIWGLIELYEATFDARHLENA